MVTATAVGVGLLLTHIALSSAAVLVETELGRPAPAGTSAISIDGTVLLIVGAVTAAVAICLSVLPLLLTSGARLTPSRGGSSSTTTPGRATRRLRSAVLAFEVAQ